MCACAAVVLQEEEEEDERQRDMMEPFDDSVPSSQRISWLQAQLLALGVGHKELEEGMDGNEDGAMTQLEFRNGLKASAGSAAAAGPRHLAWRPSQPTQRTRGARACFHAWTSRTHTPPRPGE